MITAVVLVLASALPAFGQEKREPLPKRGDTVLVKGCISGGKIESDDMKVQDGEGQYSRLVTYRLTGDKKLLEEIKKEHNGHVDVLTAVLKSELPIDERKRLGNTSIGIGLPGRTDPAAPKAVPALEVKSLEHTELTCR